MRIAAVFAFLGLAVACGSFGAQRDDGPGTADAGDAQASVPADALAPTCGSLHAPLCSGKVELLDFTRSSINQQVAAGTFMRGDDGCGLLHVACKSPASTTLEAYFTRDLGPGLGHFVVHQKIRGPVEQSNATGNPKLPLTFGCGLFLETDGKHHIETRFEVSIDDVYEIDGNNDDTGLDGFDPPGVAFEGAGDPKPSRTDERDFDLEITVDQDQSGKGGHVRSHATIAGVTRDALAIPYVGTITQKTLRCGLLQVDQTQQELCDLTIRQMELEVCPP